jgi:hypothetical protein
MQTATAQLQCGAVTDELRRFNQVMAGSESRQNPESRQPGPKGITMLGRSLWLVLILGAAVGVPYVATEWPKLKAKVTGQAETGSAGVKVSPAGAVPPGAASSTVMLPPLVGVNPKPDELPLVEMTEAFQFSVTPAWVISRWPRVSSGLPDEHLQGLRVALISGMREDDVAGSLTYYFVPSQRCAKITFTGTTGDPRRITALMVERFGFQGFTNGEPGVQRYEIRWNGKALSEFTIRPAAVVRSSSPLERYQVQLAIFEPSVK